MSVASYLPAEQFRYYRSLLSAQEQVAYDALLCGLLHFNERMRLPCSKDRAATVFEYLLMDTPELFYVSHRYNIEYNMLWESRCWLHCSYRFDEAEVCSLLEYMVGRIRELIDSLCNQSKLVKIQRIHDFLTRTVYGDSNRPYAHEAAGPLVYGIGVCDGFSKSFKFIADRLGLKGIVTSGEAEGGPHAWNLVELGGRFYHLDCTFDTTIMSGKEIEYPYFLLTDTEIRETHSWELPLPSCG